MGDALVQAIVLVADLATARRHMEGIGFTVLDGGRHPGRGTANLIVPFGRQYLELLAVVDSTEAAASPQGRPVLAALERRGPGLARWSVESADIEARGRRLGLAVESRQ
ncbi:MAG: VOC family protein, partial [Acidimicrobiales bacterium]